MEVNKMAGIGRDEYIRRHGVQAWEEYKESKRSTLEKSIAKYGVEEGTLRYNESTAKKAVTLKNQIAKYGIEEGSLRYKQRIEKDKTKGTLKGYIDRYGEELGPQKYLEKNSKLSVGIDSLKSKGFSDEEIVRIKEIHVRKSTMTLENQIERYGVEDGTIRYQKWLSNSRIRSHRTVDFWIARGYTEQEANQAISELQDNTSLKKFIARYGQEVGLLEYLALNAKRTEYLRITKNSVSKLENRFFEELAKITTLDLEKGKTSRIVINHKVYFCDYIDVKKNRVIEVNGVFWHMKPGKFKSIEVNPVTKRLASDIWEYDQTKIEKLKIAGFETLVVWEDDINRNLEEQLLVAKKFLEE
jgi:G:T-mismatch repair DNA endonuclease (very short patch repair protein)